MFTHFLFSYFIVFLFHLEEQLIRGLRLVDCHEMSVCHHIIEDLVTIVFILNH